MGPHRLHVRHRRPQARLRSHRHRRAHFHARRRRGDGAGVRCLRQPGRRTRAGQGGKILSDPPPGAQARRPIALTGSPPHRHQGHRLDLSLPERRQGRRVRRRRHGQDRPHHGTDQQHRQAPWRRVGVRRRRRAHPGRQRSLQGNVGGRRHQAGRPRRVENRSRVRPDERAARARACASPWPASP